MKVIITRSELLKGVLTVQSAVAAKQTMPILANILIEAKENKIEFIATDLDIGIRCSVTAEVVDKGSITINAKKLSDICRELPDVTIDLETDENQRLILVSKNSQFKIHGLPKDDFPILPEVRKDKSLKIKGSVLQEMIRKTVFAVSADETRYVLNGVYFAANAGKLKLVATDGHRLAFIQRKLEGKNEDNSNVIIPNKTLNELSKIISENSKGKEEENIVEIIATDNQIKFIVSGIEIVSRLIEGQFPNYEQVIPKDSDKKAEVSVAELAAATRRVSILASEKSYSVRYKLEKNNLTISTKTPDIGEAKESMSVEYQGGEEITIAYNAKYVLDVLKNISSDHVIIEMTQPLNPGVFKPQNEADYLCVIMPMRT